MTYRISCRGADVPGTLPDAVRTLGSGFDPATQVGPLVSARHQKRVMDYIGIGRGEGGRILAGGERGGDAGYFVQPTVFADVPQDARIAREEIFGPVVVAQPFDTLDDAVRLANDSAYGLGASLWSNDLARVQSLIPRIAAGAIIGGGWTEADGSGPSVFTTRLSTETGIPRLTGRKFYSTGSRYADWLEYSAVDDTGELIIAALPKDSPGVTLSTRAG